MISISICLSDLPRESITESKTNKKKYINLIVAEKQAVDTYGNSHTVFVSQSKDDREAKKEKVYVGNGKGLGEKPKQQSSTGSSITVHQQSSKQPWE